MITVYGATEGLFWLATLEAVGGDLRRGIVPLIQVQVLKSASAAPIGIYHPPLEIKMKEGGRE